MIGYRYLTAFFILLCLVVVVFILVLSSYSNYFLTNENYQNDVKKYVIISCNIDDEKTYFYSFYLPITAQAWRIVGYEPLILIISSDDKKLKNKQKLTVMKYLNKLNVTLINVKSDPGYQKITAMVSRLFIAYLNETIVGENDFIVTSDADLIPILKYNYNHISSDEINLWNPYCCDKFDYNGKKVRMYAMAHIGMKKKLWRKLFSFNESSKALTTSSVYWLVKKYYNDNLFKKNDDIQRGDDTWYLDQKIFGVAVHQFVEEEKKAKKNLIPLLGKRLNRMPKFYNKLNIYHYKDFHAFHEEIKDRLPALLFFIEHLFDKQMYSLLKEYASEFFSK